MAADEVNVSKTVLARLESLQAAQPAWWIPAATFPIVVKRAMFPIYDLKKHGSELHVNIVVGPRAEDRISRCELLVTQTIHVGFHKLLSGIEDVDTADTVANFIGEVRDDFRAGNVGYRIGEGDGAIGTVTGQFEPYIADHILNFDTFVNVQKFDFIVERTLS